jgi:hypothetical protein
MTMLAAACAAAAYFTLAGVAGAASSARSVERDVVCGVSESCISFTTKVVGGPAAYLNFQVTLCESDPACEVPDLSTAYTSGEGDTDAPVDDGATYFITVGQSHAVDAARASRYTTTIACTSQTAGQTMQSLSSGIGQIAIPLPATGPTLVKCTITNTYSGPPLTQAKHARKPTGRKHKSS